MKHLIKLLLITLLFTSATLFAEEFKKPPYDKRLDLKVDGKLWYDYADTNSDFAYNLGVYYQQNLKEYKTAEFWYEYALNLNDKNINAIFNLCIIYEDRKEYDKAINLYKKAVQLNDTQASINLGLLYSAQENYFEAIKYYKKAIERV
ncbi:tetratricopeptide repeat protein [Sulfurimonas sp.]|uniref:tetratricopeptide repeat protein n=1 Tax=Sulfurimonas sp. TaxID=2022749 RepID=UPI003D150A8B